jgi:hypothetical protein
VVRQARRREEEKMRPTFNETQQHKHRMRLIKDLDNIIQHTSAGEIRDDLITARDAMIAELYKEEQKELRLK